MKEAQRPAELCKKLSTSAESCAFCMDSCHCFTCTQAAAKTGRRTLAGKVRSMSAMCS